MAAETNRLAERMAPETIQTLQKATISVADITAMLIKMADNSGLFVDGKMREYLRGHGELSVIMVRNEDMGDFIKRCGAENISCMNLHLSKDGMKNMTTFAVKKGDLERALQISKDVHGLESFKLTSAEAGEKWKGKAVVKVDNLSYKEARLLQEELAGMERDSIMVANREDDPLKEGIPVNYYVLTPKDGIGKSAEMDDLDKAVLSMEMKMVSDYGLAARRHIENEWNMEETLSQLMEGNLENHTFYDAANPKNHIDITRLDDGNLYAEIIRRAGGKEYTADTLTLNLDDEAQRSEFERRISNEVKGYAIGVQMTTEDFKKNKNRPKILYRADSDISRMYKIDNDLDRNHDQMEKLIQLKLGFNTEDHAVNFINNEIDINKFESEEVKKDLQDLIMDGKESSIITRIESNLTKINCVTGMADKYIVKKVEDPEQEIPEEVYEQNLEEEQENSYPAESKKRSRTTDDAFEDIPAPESFTSDNLEDFDYDDIPDGLEDAY